MLLPKCQHFGLMDAGVSVEQKLIFVGPVPLHRPFPQCLPLFRQNTAYSMHFPRAKYLPLGSVSSTFPFSTASLPRSHTCRMPPSVAKPS